MRLRELSESAREELTVLRMDYVLHRNIENKVLRVEDLSALNELATKGYVTDVRANETHMWYTLTEKATIVNGRPLVC